MIQCSAESMMEREIRQFKLSKFSVSGINMKMV